MKTANDPIHLLCNPDYVDTGIALINDVRTMRFDDESEAYSDLVILVFVRKGMMSLSIDGEKHAAQAHQLLIYRPGRRISDVEYSPDFQAHAVMLTVRYGQSVVAVAGNIWKYIVSLDSQPVIALPRATSRLLLSYYPVIINEVERPNNMYYREVVSSLIRSMLCSLINDLRSLAVIKPLKLATASQAGESSPQALALFNKFIDLLTNERCTQRKIEYYANRLCVSPKYLSVVCKRIGKRSAHQWITEAIVNGIHNHLRYSDKSVKEIAIIYGFPNLAFFSRYVKQHLGCAPTDFRKK